MSKPKISPVTEKALLKIRRYKTLKTRFLHSHIIRCLYHGGLIEYAYNDQKGYNKVRLTSLGELVVDNLVNYEKHEQGYVYTGTEKPMEESWISL